MTTLQQQYYYMQRQRQNALNAYFARQMMMAAQGAGSSVDAKLPNDKLKLVVETTDQYKKTGIYHAERDDASKPVVIDWGDGTVEQVDGDVSQKVHEYATVGEFKATISNVKTFAASANNLIWYDATSQNRYTLKEVVIGSSVTSIEYRAFFGCTSLTSVTIPDSVMSIGERAFLGCSGLTSVTIGNSVTSIGEYTFYNCSNLTSVTIPDSVTSIGQYAFYYCSGLTSITIPNSVTSIESSAFWYCSGLTSVTIGNSVKNIGWYAFAWCSNLTSVTIGNSVTSIGEGAFYGCSGLTSVTIGNSVKNIGWYAFAWCSNLTSVTIGNSVTSIGEGAFYGCSGLTSVTIPDSVTSIDGYAFENCSRLESITLGNNLHSLSERMFFNCPKLVEVVANGMTCEHVAANAASWYLGISSDGSTHLVVVYCSDGVVVINDADSSSGEEENPGLTIVTYTDGSTKTFDIRGELTSSSIDNIAQVRDVQIGSNVTSIGEEAFYSCSWLTSVTFDGNAPTVGAAAFSGVASGCKVVVDSTKTGWPAEGTTWNGLIIQYK